MRLVQQTLRCQNEISHRKRAPAWTFRGGFGRNSRAGEEELVLCSQDRECARDMVSECRKCGSVICRVRSTLQFLSATLITLRLSLPLRLFSALRSHLLMPATHLNLNRIVPRSLLLPQRSLHASATSALPARGLPFLSSSPTRRAPAPKRYISVTSVACGSAETMRNTTASLHGANATKCSVQASAKGTRVSSAGAEYNVCTHKKSSWRVRWRKSLERPGTGDRRSRG